MGAADKGGSRQAPGPGQTPTKKSRWHAAWHVLRRVWTKANEQRVLLVAGGVTFYLLLALFPALAAFVSLYGFVADPRTIAEHIAFLGGMLPTGGLDIIRGQLVALAARDHGSLSFGFVVGLLVALWSANNGVKAMIQAMNIAYEETEKRGIVRLNLQSGLFTLGAILIGILLVTSVGVVPAALAMVQLDHLTETLISLSRWPVLVAFVWLSISIVYRYAPSRDSSKRRWFTWGAAIATIVWLDASVGFSQYLQHFADYNATYGSLGAVIGFMVWVWISVIILIVGAEINAEIERSAVR